MPTPSFATDIRPLFTDEDIQHMSFVFDLSAYEDVKAHSVDILDRISRRKDDQQLMPPAPRGPWPPQQIQLFQDWINGGMQP